MQKIISLFQRNYDTDRLVRDEVVPGAEWVLEGEGTATIKWDGTCCLYKDGQWYKRYEVKKGGKWPENFMPASDVDPVTGKQQGWVPVGDGPQDRWHREAIELDQSFGGMKFVNGATYELIGPKIQGNPEGFLVHYMVRHGCHILAFCPRDFEGLKEYFAGRNPNIEGIVWHHPDGRMVKIKAKDFGITRHQPQAEAYKP